MRTLLLHIPIFICCFLWHGEVCGQTAIDEQIYHAYLNFEKGQYSEAMHASSLLSDTMTIANDSSRIQLAFLKYYQYRLSNRRQLAIKAMQAVEEISSKADISSALKTQLNCLLSITSVEANQPDQIATYDSMWSMKSMLTPLEQVQKERISWYYNHVSNSLTDQKLNLEFILNILIKNNLNRHPEMPLTLRDLGILSKTYSDFEQAINYFSQEKKLYLHYFDSSHIGFGISEYHIASVYYEMLEFQKSLDHYLVVQKNFEKLGMPDRRMRYVYEAIGDMNFELGHTKKAAKAWHRASQYRAVKNRDLLDQRRPIIDSFIRTNQVNQVISIYEDALAFRQDEYGEHHQLTAQCHAYIGRAYAKKNAPRKSAEKYHQALQIFIPGLVDSSITAIPDTISSPLIDIYLLEALVGKCEALHKLFLQTRETTYLQAAFEHIIIAEHALQNLRFNPRSESSQLSLSKLSRHLIESGLAICHDLFPNHQDSNALQKAFSLMELSRSFLLHQALQQSKAFNISNVPTDIVQQEQNLRNEMATYAAKIDMEVKRCTEANNDYVSTWKNHLTRLRIQHNELLNNISKRYPEFYKLKFDHHTVSIGDIQTNVLSSDAVAISYFQGIDHLYALAISPSSVSLHQINYQTNFSQLIDSMQMSISQHAFILANPQASKSLFIRSATTLHDQLLASIELPIANINQLYIIPDLDLHKVPFEVLLTQNDSHTSSYNQLSYLLHDVDISYCTSMNLLNEGVHDKRQTKLNYIGFAPSYQHSNSASITSRAHGNLSFNVAEVKSAAHYFNGKFFSGQEATKDVFLKAIDKGNILHVAAHAIVDDEYPLLSHIAFSSTESDSILYAYEIYNQSMRADLTVLSACNTGVGKIHAGEGAMSLSRAFQYAGCPSLLMTLWSVDDQGSSQIMELFFEYLSEGQSKHQSLSSAKRAYLTMADPASSHPFYWAGYVLLGNTDALNISSSSNYYWLWLLLIAPLLFWLIKRKN